MGLWLVKVYVLYMELLYGIIVSKDFWVNDFDKVGYHTPQKGYGE